MLRWLWLTGLVIALDQLSKWLAEQMLTPHVSQAIVPSVNITLVYNTGAAFSFLSQASGWQRWFFSLLAVAVSVLIVLWMRRLRPQEQWTAAGLAMVLGGALGNLIDRLIHGHVIDFIDLYYHGLHWPTFNIADSAITLGAAVLIVHGLFARQPGPNALND
jgi:signal peptidase II